MTTVNATQGSYAGGSSASGSQTVRVSATPTNLVWQPYMGARFGPAAAGIYGAMNNPYQFGGGTSVQARQTGTAAGGSVSSAGRTSSPTSNYSAVFNQTGPGARVSQQGSADAGEVLGPGSARVSATGPNLLVTGGPGGIRVTAGPPRPAPTAAPAGAGSSGGGPAPIPSSYLAGMRYESYLNNGGRYSFDQWKSAYWDTGLHTAAGIDPGLIADYYANNSSPFVGQSLSGNTYSDVSPDATPLSNSQLGSVLRTWGAGQASPSSSYGSTDYDLASYGNSGAGVGQADQVVGLGALPQPGWINREMAQSNPTPNLWSRAQTLGANLLQDIYQSGIRGINNFGGGTPSGTAPQPGTFGGTAFGNVPMRVSSYPVEQSQSPLQLVGDLGSLFGVGALRPGGGLIDQAISRLMETGPVQSALGAVSRYLPGGVTPETRAAIQAGNYGWPSDAAVAEGLLRTTPTGELFPEGLAPGVRQELIARGIEPDLPFQGWQTSQWDPHLDIAFREAATPQDLANIADAMRLTPGFNPSEIDAAYAHYLGQLGSISPRLAAGAGLGAAGAMAIAPILANMAGGQAPAQPVAARGAGTITPGADPYYGGVGPPIASDDGTAFAGHGGLLPPTPTNRILPGGRSYNVAGQYVQGYTGGTERLANALSMASEQLGVPIITAGTVAARSPGSGSEHPKGNAVDLSSAAYSANTGPGTSLADQSPEYQSIYRALYDQGLRVLGNTNNDPNYWPPSYGDGSSQREWWHFSFDGT